jgi:hypothetical protein
MEQIREPYAFSLSQDSNTWGLVCVIAVTRVSAKHCQVDAGLAFPGSSQHQQRDIWDVMLGPTSVSSIQYSTCVLQRLVKDAITREDMRGEAVLHIRYRASAGSTLAQLFAQIWQQLFCLSSSSRASKGPVRFIAVWSGAPSQFSVDKSGPQAELLTEPISPIGSESTGYLLSLHSTVTPQVRRRGLPNRNRVDIS